MSPSEKTVLIQKKCLALTSTDLRELFQSLTDEPYVSIHGPEHHIIDGACVLTAYRNAGGTIDLPAALAVLAERGLQMPGAMCGNWGVCGAVTSVGAALSIIDGTGPLSTEDWGKHMALTSGIVGEMAAIGGPRCCKRDGMLALKNAAEYLSKRCGLDVQFTPSPCVHSSQNAQCIHSRCPFYKRKKTVAFVCVHNSCRSQIAEALGKHLAQDAFESCSAGTEAKPRINPDAVRLMKQHYGIDMEASQYPKLYTKIPTPDIAISMGCNVACPNLGRPFDEDWGLPDPTGQSDAVFLDTIRSIEAHILALRARLLEDGDR